MLLKRHVVPLGGGVATQVDRADTVRAVREGGMKIDVLDDDWRLKRTP